VTQTCKNNCCPNLKNLFTPKIFKALCDPTRISILAYVAEQCCELTVSQVAKCCPIDISVVSRHLAALRDVGILEAKKKGKEVFYSLKAQSLVSCLRAIADEIENCCPTNQEKDHENRRSS
jgi:DNA-binding transcriptional ArsR family regulator